MNKEIKANELRIGNYLIDSNSRLCVVDTLSKDIIDCGIFAVHDCITTFPIQPIPLTEEWLLKFGFEKAKQDNENFLQLKLKARIFIRFIDYDCNNLDIFQDGKILSFQSGIIKHVHQLQNLYFALTGEELNLINEL